MTRPSPEPFEASTSERPARSFGRAVEPEPSRWQLPTSPPPTGTDIVAIGADLEPGTLLAAYRVGLFPMPFDRNRIAWFSPDPRGILPVDGLRISRSLRQSLRRYDATIDRRFRDVMRACADPSRDGAWIDDAFIDAYTHLHELGWAHSIEIYHKGTDVLVGGLYGVGIGRLFAGESMFHTATDASKVALVHLVHLLREQGATLLDVQWTTPHLRSLGAIDVARGDYLARLASALDPRSAAPKFPSAPIDQLGLEFADTGPLPTTPPNRSTDL